MSERLELLKLCLSLQAESGKEQEQINPALNVLLEHLNIDNNIKYFEDPVGNIYIVKGESELYPCIVAHSDQVAKYNPNKAVIHLEGSDWIRACDRVTGLPHDLGGDDLCSVWAIMQALKDLPTLKAVIFVSEEVGCKGSAVADNNFFKDCSFIVQFDRAIDRGKGKRQVIEFTNNITVVSKEFKEFLQPFMDEAGFVFDNGILTDVGQLVKNGVGICAVNTSAGYACPHTDKSYVVISELFASYDMWVKVIRACDKQYKLDVSVPVKADFSKELAKFKRQVKDMLLEKYNSKKGKKYGKGKLATVTHTSPYEMISWFVETIDKIDDLRDDGRGYERMLDTIWDELITEKEEKVVNYADSWGDLGNCKNPSICKSVRISGEDDITGLPIEVCTECNKHFSLGDADWKGGQLNLHKYFRGEEDFYS